MTLHNNTSPFLLPEQGWKIVALNIYPYVGIGGAKVTSFRKQVGPKDCRRNFWNTGGARE